MFSTKLPNNCGTQLSRGSTARPNTTQTNAVCVGQSTPSTIQDTRTAFDERFALCGFLGSGSFGEVQVALKKGTYTEVAVKTVPKPQGLFTSNNMPSEAVNWEIVNSSQYVAKLEGVYEDSDTFHFVQEYCAGGDLQAYLDERGPMDEFEVVQVMHSVLMFLSQCHSNSMCYGDVKPSNFLMKTQYPATHHLIDPSMPKGPLNIKAIDFGSSQRYDPTLRLRRPVGTRLYMAPEMYGRFYGLEADVWSAGVMMYQLLTRRFPFWDIDAEYVQKFKPQLVTDAIRKGDLIFDQEVWANFSPEAQDLVKSMLVRDPLGRITAEEALAHPWFHKVGARSPAAQQQQYAGGAMNNIVPMPSSLHN